MANQFHTCSLSRIFGQVHAPAENDFICFAACGRQTLRGIFGFCEGRSLLLGDVHAEILHGQPGQGAVGVHLGQGIVDGGIVPLLRRGLQKAQHLPHSRSVYPDCLSPRLADLGK